MQFIAGGRGRENNSLGTPSTCDLQLRSHRLEITNQTKTLEREYFRTGNRIRKRKQQIHELAAAMEVDETGYAQLDEQIHTLNS